MVTLVAETGAGLVNSNSYVDLAYADAYFEGHPYFADAWADITDEIYRANLLIAASRWIDNNFEWIGYPYTTTQAMGWPRQYAYDRNGYMILTDVVPENVKQAVCEQAYFMSKGDPYVPAAGVGITDLKVDVIELSFDKAVRPSAVPSPVLALLRGFAEYLGHRRYRKVLVG